MKIGILTQPLCANYGGIIQNWALQQVLKKLGHEPITIDIMPAKYPIKSFFHINLLACKSLLFKGDKSLFQPYYHNRKELFNNFVGRNINITKQVHKLSQSIIHEYGIEALLVGSDQVWRPRYNVGVLEDMFLRFAIRNNCPKASYAASFGTDKWEYNLKQTKECKKLISKFTRVSVREESGMRLCHEYLGVNSIQVLDPTLLLDKLDYLELIRDICPICNEPFLAAYVLDINEEIRSKIEKKANTLNVKPLVLTADCGAQLTVEQWISVFRDAKFIYTDSFHGSIFSLIFEKEFEFVSNEGRGETRFELIKKLQTEGISENRKQTSLEFLSSIYG